MHTQLMSFGGYALTGWHAAFSQFILFANVSVITDKARMEKRVKVLVLMLSIIAQVTCTLLLEVSGRLLENGKKTVKSWKEMKFHTREEKAYMTKFRKSCRPLRTGKEGFFIISRITVLKFMRSIIRGTFRAVLTIGRV
ncbi:hypothetical protein Fcan01_20334 [Folsomia candida]|uniref:Uncharacterized protein n=1 Tax=Folsomia candida TaxID=158441 RepID=A0A226DHK4_FOLCA|nr:hypothetical protein Fcan01_20334 [Folsomia candida]